MCRQILYCQRQKDSSGSIDDPTGVYTCGFFNRLLVYRDFCIGLVVTRLTVIGLTSHVEPAKM